MKLSTRNHDRFGAEGWLGKWSIGGNGYDECEAGADGNLTVIEGIRAFSKGWFPLLCLSLASASAGAAERTEGGRPNIVLILADDLGYGDLGCQGQRRIPTPHIDRLASEGVRFAQFYSGGTVCAPSRNVLLTGQNPGRIHIRGNRPMDLRAEDRTLAEMLRAAGYRTGMIGKWGLGAAGSPAVPTRRGFDFFTGYLDHVHAHNSYPTYLWRNEERLALPNVVPNEGNMGQGKASERRKHTQDVFMREALDFVAAEPGRPFFLFFATTLPHANNEAGNDGMEAPPEGPRDFVDPAWPKPERDFAAAVARLDADVGRLMEHLKSLGLEDDTLVIFTSDNGPHSEGGHDARFFGSSGGLRGQKRDLYEGGVRVPFIVSWPGRIPAGAVTEQVGWFPDVAATLAAVAAVPEKARLEDNGLDLLPWLLEPRRPTAERELYWEFYELGTSQAVRFGDWKAVRRPIGGDVIELYNLTRDLQEKTDVAAEFPGEARKAAALMDATHTPHPSWPVPAVKAGAAR